VQLKRKLPWILTGKSLLAVASISMVALALATYTVTVNISFNAFFTQGATSQSWTMNTATGTRYLPGDTSDSNGFLTVAPTLGNLTSFGFATITGLGYVKINLGSAESASNFQSFKIFVLTSTGTASWTNATLFTDTTFTTTLPNGIDGLTGTLTGYLHITATTRAFYAIQVNYVLASAPSGTPTAVFDYTPSLN
jgi:hypothetical protein